MTGTLGVQMTNKKVDAQVDQSVDRSVEQSVVGKVNKVQRAK